jgi:hypothetical protein
MLDLAATSSHPTMSRSFSRVYMLRNLGHDHAARDGLELSGRDHGSRLKNAKEISADLDRCHEQAPGEAPPADNRGNGGGACLTLPSAGATRNRGQAFPGSDDDGRPDRVSHVDVIRARPAATRAVPFMDHADVLVNDVLRNLRGNLAIDVLALAVGVAVAECAIRHTSEEDGRTTETASRHTLPSRKGDVTPSIQSSPESIFRAVCGKWPLPSPACQRSLDRSC